MDIEIPVQFDETDPAEADGDYVVRHGKIFEFGEYPDKEFSLTPDEFEAANADSDTVPIDVQHTPTVFDGKLGGLVSKIVLGNELHGTVKIPRWLDKVLHPEGGGPGLKVSCDFNRETKRLQKLSIVTKPRVRDAVLMAAFAADKEEVRSTPHGRDRIQMIHDMAAQGGAICRKPSDDDAEFTANPEAAALQSVHDAASKAGAKCRAANGRAVFSGRLAQRIHDVAAAHDRKVCQYGPAAATPPGGTASFGKGGPHPYVKYAHDLACKHGARCPGKSAQMSRGGKMSIRDSFKKMIMGGKKDDATFSDEHVEQFLDIIDEAEVDDAEGRPGPAGEAAQFKVEENETVKALQAKVARLEKEQADEKDAAVRREAAQFAAGMVRDGRHYPNVRPVLEALYLTLARDDADADKGSVTFGEGDQARSLDRLTVLKGVLATVPQHGLFDDRVVGNRDGVKVNDKDGTAALFEVGPDESPGRPMSEKRRKELLAKTDLGRAALAAGKP